MLAGMSLGRLDPQHIALGPDDAHLLSPRQIRSGNAPDGVAQGQAAEAADNGLVEHGLVTDEMLCPLVEQGARRAAGTAPVVR